MIDLDKEFRTLRLLAKTLLILGIALLLAGAGTALLTRPAQPPAAPPVAGSDGSEGGANAPAPSPKSGSLTQTMLSYVGELGARTALLGAVFVALGLLLRRVLRNTVDDDSFSDTDQELFKAYAEQLAAAEKQKKKKRHTIE